MLTQERVPLADKERATLCNRLLGNALHEEPIHMRKSDTSFVDEPDDEVVTAIKSIPTHY